MFIASWRSNDAAPIEAIETSNRPMMAAGAIAFTGAYLVCHFGMHGWPAGTQLEAWEWLLGLVPLAAVLGILSVTVAPLGECARLGRPCGGIRLAAGANFSRISMGLAPRGWTRGFSAYLRTSACRRENIGRACSSKLAHRRSMCFASAARVSQCEVWILGDFRVCGVWRCIRYLDFSAASSTPTHNVRYSSCLAAVPGDSY